MRAWFLLVATCVALPTAGWSQCEGSERWGVKVGADPGATQVNLQNPIRTSLHDLVRLARPTLPAQGDINTRLPAERTVRVVDAFLVRFKREGGKDGDGDFHLVISDATLQYTRSTGPVSEHSFIAEIPDPVCIPGAGGIVTAPSRFATQLARVHTRFLNEFPNFTSNWNEADGIPVRLTGVVFFDRNHGQVGRALNGLELHPLLDIEFNPPPFETTPAVTGAPVFANPGFESDSQGWSASAGVITRSSSQPARTGQWKAWLGGYGESHRDSVWRRLELPAAAQTISVSFFLHVNTEEDNQVAVDKLWVRVRAANGQLLRTLGTFSNQQSAAGFSRQTFDLTPYRGRTIRLSLEAREDGSARTSFVVDDFSLVIENP